MTDTVFWRMLNTGADLAELVEHQYLPTWEGPGPIRIAYAAVDRAAEEAEPDWREVERGQGV